MNALSAIGFPANLAYVIVTTIQIAPRFQARAATILDAQRARGLETEGGFLRQGACLSPIGYPFSSQQPGGCRGRALAIEARAFNRSGAKTSLVEIPDAPWESVARWILVVSMVAVAGISIWWRVKT